MSAPRKSSRREFLQGKSAADAVADAADAAWGGPALEPLPEVPTASYLVQWSRRAMACQFSVYLNSGQYVASAEAAVAALDLVDELEDQLTVYRDHSEISRLNAAAAERSVEVEPRLFDLLSQAVAMYHATGGAYDITAAPLSKVWGFSQRAGRIPDSAELAAARATVGSQWLELDAESCSVRFLQPGVEINLASIGKGYALDRASQQLAAAEIHDFLLHGGHSSVLARGSCASESTGGWSVGVRNPLRPEQRLGELRLYDEALSTSGSGTQFFVHNGRRYGHILDPRSGWPAEGVLSATVIAPTAARAEALSTALYVLGADAARALCDRQTGVGAIILCAGRRAGSLDVHCIGRAEDTWQKLENSGP